MIPLGDVDRRPLRFPLLTVLIIGANVLAFSFEITQGSTFIRRWALVPADVVAGRNWVTLWTSMFMHGGPVHILGNMVFFWAFGPQIEDVMGPLRYLLFYVLGGTVAALAQVAVIPTSTIPTVGASGAIAAIMGVFLITYPHDRIRALLLLGWFAQVAFVPATVLVGIWFLTQVFSGVGALIKMQSGGVGYMAHIGGFLFGVLLGRLFESRQRRIRHGLG
jgi:membrane associated rhomboid family serine protease